MEYKLIVEKDQKFDVNQVKELSICCSCNNCNYMNCTRNNYEVKLEKYRYSIEEFIETFRDKIDEAESIKELLIDKNLISELADCFPKFPKDTFWDIRNNGIGIVKKGAGGKFFPIHVKINLYRNSVELIKTDICKKPQENIAYKIKEMVEELIIYKQENKKNI